MTQFWWIFFAYFAFSVAIMLGYPKQVRQLLRPEAEPDPTFIKTLYLFLAVALAMTVIYLVRRPL